MSSLSGREALSGPWGAVSRDYVMVALVLCADLAYLFKYCSTSLDLSVVNILIVVFQPKNDMIPFLESLQEYKGILDVFPDILSVHKVRISFSVVFLFRKFSFFLLV